MNEYEVCKKFYFDGNCSSDIACPFVFFNSAFWIG